MTNTPTVHSDDWDFDTINQLVDERIRQLRTTRRIAEKFARKQAIEEMAESFETTPEHLSEWMAAHQQAKQAPADPLDLPLDALDKPSGSAKAMLRQMVEGMEPDTMRLLVYDNRGSVVIAQKHLHQLTRSLGWGGSKESKSYETQTLPAQRNGQVCYILKVTRYRVGEG